MKFNVANTTDDDDKAEYLKELANRINGIIELDAKMEATSQEYKDLEAQHKLQRAEEKKADDREREAEEKDRLFNEKASEVIGNFNRLTADKKKFETS